MGLLDVPGISRTNLDARTITGTVNVSTSGTLALNKITLVDAHAGAVTMTLPTGAPNGTLITIKRDPVDTTTNVISITGTIDGATKTQSIVLAGDESRSYIMGSAGWTEGADHKPLSGLDGRFVLATPQGQSDLEAQRSAALRPFWTALANRANAPVDILGIGHSFIEGVRSSSYNQTMLTYLRDALRSRFQPAGIVGGYGYHTTPTIAVGDDPLVNTGGGGNATNGLGRISWQMTAAGHKRVLTCTGTGVDIFYSTYSVANAGYYKVDGGSSVTINALNSTGGHGSFHTVNGNRVMVRGLTAGSHTIEVGWQSGGGFFSEGFMIYNGDESQGIRMWKGGHSSQQSSFFIDSSNPYWIDCVPVIQPSLVVICMMCNDYGGTGTDIASATTKTNLQSLITNIKAACTVTPAFVLAIEYQRDTTAGAPIEPWANYIAVANAVAAADSTVLTYDMGARFGAGPFAAGNILINTDKIHPTNAGHQFWADSLAEFISPR